MDDIERLADLSVKRGCGFAALAIGTTMTGLAGMPLLAVKSGAILFTLMAVTLAGRAFGALRRSYKRTEVWAMLAVDRRLPQAIAQQVIGTALQATYWRYAEFAAAVALFFWVFAIALWLFAGH